MKKFNLSILRKFSLACVVLLVLVAFTVTLSSNKRKAARQELEAVYARVQPGVSISEIEVAIREGEFRHLKLRQLDHSNLVVQTPLEWGARNWVLWIEVKDDKVAALRIRFHDDKEDRPDKAPPDKEDKG